MSIGSVYKAFLECAGGISTDTRNCPENSFFVALKGDRFDGNLFAEKALENGARYALVSDQTVCHDNRYILVSNTLETLQELATYHRKKLNTPILALTGSNGKTTTKELMHAVVGQQYKTLATKGNLNNHIGVPLTLLNLTKETEFGIVEMGANHPGEIAFLTKMIQPNLGYITNFGKAHLEGFGSLEGVIKAKSELYDYLEKEKLPILLNADDKVQLKKVKTKNIFTFSENHPAHAVVELLETSPFLKVKFKDTEIQTQLVGTYNFTNIAAAIGLGAYLNIGISQIKKGIESYCPSNNRSEVILKGQTTIVLDAYNANPSSMRVSLQSFAKRNNSKWVFLGDMMELGAHAKQEHQDLMNWADTLDIEYFVWIGQHFNACTTPNKNHITFAQKPQVFEWLKSQEKVGTQILVKGSRSMQMETLLDHL